MKLADITTVAGQMTSRLALWVHNPKGPACVFKLTHYPIKPVSRIERRLFRSWGSVADNMPKRILKPSDCCSKASNFGFWAAKREPTGWTR
jgi:hypothetical protein